MHGSVRPLKRNEEQKLVNRQSILFAGMQTFRDKGFANASVEDVLVRAEVSRATFYKHFSSKLSLAEALMEEMASRLERSYDRLASIEQPTRSDIILWLNTIAEIFEENKLLMTVLSSLDDTEPSLVEALRVANETRLGKLAKSFPAFRGALPDGTENAEARDRAMLLLLEVDFILFRLTVRDWEIDRKTAIHFLAGQIEDFVNGAPRE
jgi:AcrR family transcriptional regulator